MRYVADMLTFLRLLLAFIVPGLVLERNWMLALILFGMAVLSDALDGWCARRWPYTPEEEARLPWRRIDHHALDNGPDALMVLLAVVALVSSIHYWWVLAAVIYGVGALFFVAVLVLVRPRSSTSCLATGSSLTSVWWRPSLRVARVYLRRRRWWAWAFCSPFCGSSGSAR